MSGVGSSGRILLCGGTGDLGRRIAARLAGSGAELRALVRPTTSDTELRGLGFEIVSGDLRYADSLPAAVDGIRTIVSTVGSLARTLSGERGLRIRDVDHDGYASLIAAAERAHVERFVFLSAALPPIAAKLAPYAAAKAATEQRLRRADLRPVIVRPDMFQELWLSPKTQFNWPKGKLMIFGRGDAKARYVATDDVAALTAYLALAEDPPESVDFGGPEALTRNEAADLFERESGRPMRRRYVPRGALRIGATVLRRPKPTLASVMGMALAADLGDAPLDDGPLIAAGIHPRSATEFVRSVVHGPAAGG